MHTKRFMIALSLILFLAGLGLAQDFDIKAPQAEKKDTASVAPKDTANAAKAPDKNPAGSTVIAYYFHYTKRCATCMKLEAYSQEAVEGGFEKEIGSGKLEFRTVNVDEKENHHFIDDYQLFTKTLILSRVKNGKQTEWKNLDKIWDLVGNEKNYKEYVTKEVADFLGEK